MHLSPPPLYQFPNAAVTNGHKLSVLNNTSLLAYGVMVQKNKMDLIGAQIKGVGRAAFRSGSSRENPFSCPFQLLHGAHIPWLCTLFLSLQSQHVGPSLLHAAVCLTFSSDFPLYSEGHLNYIGPQIIRSSRISFF